MREGRAFFSLIFRYRASIERGLYYKIRRESESIASFTVFSASFSRILPVKAGLVLHDFLQTGVNEHIVEEEKKSD